MTDLEKDSHASGWMKVGECIVDLSSREILAPGARRPCRVTPKALAVLRVLAHEAGAVHTREELFAMVWSGTMPTNDVLTQAITQLRKAFSSGSDPAAGAEYIETIAKSGYRLRVPVEQIDHDHPGALTALSAGEGGGDEVVPLPGGADAGASTPPRPAADTVHASTIVPLPVPVAAPAVETAAAPQNVLPHLVAAPAADPHPRSGIRHARKRALIVFSVLLLAVTCVQALLLLRRPAGDGAGSGVSADGGHVLSSPLPPYRIINAATVQASAPSISPDGTLVAYASERDGHTTILVQTTANDEAKPLVDTPAGYADRYPAWSPDGLQIAFARYAPDGGCEVMIVGATGGIRGTVARCDGTDMLSFDWAPDGRQLVFGAMGGRYAHHGIRLLDIASGRWTSLAYSVGHDDFDYAPKFSPDGRSIAFVRNPQVGDLWLVPATGGKAQRLTRESAEVLGWSWTADSAGIVFGRRVDSEARIYRLDVRGRTLHDLGLADAQSPTVARAAGTMAFVRRRPQFALFQVDVAAPGAPAQRLFPSTGRDTQPMVAPDGRQLAFTSDRSGVYALWWGALADGASARMIEGLRPDARQPPAWSDDSRTLLVIGRSEEDRLGVYEVTPDQGQWQRLPLATEQPLQALYVPGQPMQLLLLERDADEKTYLSLLDRSGGSWRRVSRLEGVSQARIDPRDGRVLYTRLVERGLWAVAADLSAGSVQQIDTEFPTRWRYRNWQPASGRGVAYLAGDAQCATLLVSLPGTLDQRCLHGALSSAVNGFSMAPDGGLAYVSSALNDGTDVAVMDLRKD